MSFTNPCLVVGVLCLYLWQCHSLCVYTSVSTGT